MIHFQSGIELTNPKDIKDASLQYCIQLLSNREPKEEFRIDCKLKDVIHVARMAEKVPDDINHLTDEMFEETFKALSSKVGKYDFIIKGGAALKSALLKVCKSVWMSEKMPESWYETTLIQLYKGKGPRNNLENMRHIHIKNEFSKFFGHLVVSKAKPDILRNLSKFQIATKPGHRPQEHLFVLKSYIELNMSMEKAVIIQFFDNSKFFDKESLTDCMNALHKCDVKGKLYRLLYLMNHKTKFRVKTPVGLTEEALRGAGLAQGSLEGALISSVSLDSDVMQFFKNSTDEVSYFSVRLQPLLYQDDVARLAYSVESAQAGNLKMEVIAETKLLDYNHDKSGFIVVGEKKAKQKLIQELDESPLMFCKKPMKQEKITKYLGDWISTDGLADSVKVTVSKRFGLVHRAIADIRVIVDDCRNCIIGGLATGLHIWEAAVLPGLLLNSECWINIPNSVIQSLEKIQLKFYRAILSIGTGCPIPIIYWDTGGMLIKYRITKNKLLFFHHLATLSSESLAKEIFEVQKELNLPGLVSECNAILIEAGVKDVEKYSKYQWKALVNRLCRKLNEDDLLDQMKNYKKLEYDELKNEHCEMKSYMVSLNLYNARLRFKIRSKMTPTIQMNFKNDPVYKANLWTCLGCARSKDTAVDPACKDTQAHVLACEGYEDLREGKNFDDDKDLVEYFSAVIRRRMSETS